MRWLLIWSALLCGSANAQMMQAIVNARATAAALIAPNAVTSSTLEVWLEADVGCLKAGSVACANNDNAVTWQDQSGNGNDATASGCTLGPFYETSALDNGKPAMVFDSKNSTCMLDPYNGAAGTVIVVYYPYSGGTTAPSAPYGGVISGENQAGTTTSAWGIFNETNPVLAGSGSFSVRQFYYGTTANSATYSYYTNPERIRNLWSFSVMTNDGTTLNSYDQNVLLASATIPGGATVYTAPRFAIGAAYFNSALLAYSNAMVAEVIVYQGKISDSDRVGVMAWLQNKYGKTNPNGNYLMMANNRADGGYTDLNLYILQGPDGINWPYSLPTNYVPTLLSGQTSTAMLAPLFLRDMNGNLVKYNGLYWASAMRCAFLNGMVSPCVQVLDILWSDDMVPGVSGGHWHLSGSLNSDTLGATDGVTSSRGGFNDNFIVDAGNSNAIYVMFDASNNSQAIKGIQEYAVPLTLNSNGTFSNGSLITFAGTCFPFASTGTSGMSGWFTSSQPILLGGTYTAFIENIATGQGIVQFCKSTSLFSGYNGTIGSIPQTAGPIIEWPTWVQIGGNGQLWWDNNSGQIGSGPATDSALGTVSGLSGSSPNVFQKGVPSLSGTGFYPQSASVVKLPAVTLP